MALFWTCFSILAFSCIALIVAINVNYVGNNKYLKEYSRQIFELQDKNEKLRKRIRNLDGVDYPLCYTCTIKSCQWNQSYDVQKLVHALMKIYQKCEEAKKCIPCDSDIFIISNLAKQALEKNKNE